MHRDTPCFLGIPILMYIRLCLLMPSYIADNAICNGSVSQFTISRWIHCSDGGGGIIVMFLETEININIVLIGLNNCLHCFLRKKMETRFDWLK